jgi:hypothetical protein
MLVLFDQATPVPIRTYLVQHTVKTAAQCGWDRLKNGDLLSEAELSGFDVFLTTDRRILVSQDRRTLPVHFAEYVITANSSSVILLREAVSIAAAIEELVLIWTASEAEEWVNRLAWIPL